MQRKAESVLRHFAFATCVLAAVVITAAGTPAKGEPPAIRVSLSCSAERASSCDPVELELTIENLSDRTIAVLSPELEPGTLVPRFEDAVEGKRMDPQVKWAAARISDRIEIAESQSWKCTFHLEQLFPLGMRPGCYRIAFSYTPDYKTWAQTNRVCLDIAALSDEEDEQRSQAIRVLQSAEREDVIRAARAFLNAYPTGEFVNLVRLELAENQISLRRHTAGEKMLQLILSDPQTTPYEKGQANWKMAHSLRKRGQLKAALDFLNRVGTRSAARTAQRWTASRPQTP